MIEVLATVVRRHRGRSVDAGLTAETISRIEAESGSFVRVPLDRQVLSPARVLLARHGLRGADAVHLASALALRRIMSETLAMVASDQELLAAAEREGLVVLDPARNPAVALAPSP